MLPNILVSELFAKNRSQQRDVFGSATCIKLPKTHIAGLPSGRIGDLEFVVGSTPFPRSKHTAVPQNMILASELDGVAEAVWKNKTPE